MIMFGPAIIAPPPAQRSAAASPDPVVRHGVAQLLTGSEAFRALPAEDQRAIAGNTALIADYLARPEGIEGTRIPDGLGNAGARTLADDDKAATEASWDQRQKAVSDIAPEKFRANAAREG